jgi:hypothetical protein
MKLSLRKRFSSDPLTSLIRHKLFCFRYGSIATFVPPSNARSFAVPLTAPAQLLNDSENKKISGPKTGSIALFWHQLCTVISLSSLLAVKQN